MVVGLWYFTVRTSYQFPMVTQQNKDCIFKPRLFACFLHELPDGPVRVFHNLIFKLCAVWFEIVRYHIRGMVADRKQYGKERLSFFCSFVQNGQAVSVSYPISREGVRRSRFIVRTKGQNSRAIRLRRSRRPSFCVPFNFCRRSSHNCSFTRSVVLSLAMRL